MLLSEVPTIIYHLCPRTADIEYNLFLDQDFDQKITVLWYLYELVALVNKMIWAYAFCKVAYVVSERLFKIGMTFIFCNLSQFLFYMWDRNSSFFSNVCVYMCVGFVVYFLMSPEKDKAKYKSIE